MPEKIFRLLESHQRLDALLRRAERRRFVDPAEIARLRKLKTILRSRLARLWPQPA